MRSKSKRARRIAQLRLSLDAQDPASHDIEKWGGLEVPTSPEVMVSSSDSYATSFTASPEPIKHAFSIRKGRPLDEAMPTMETRLAEGEQGRRNSNVDKIGARTDDGQDSASVDLVDELQCKPAIDQECFAGVESRQPVEDSQMTGEYPNGFKDIGDPWTRPYRTLERHDKEMCDEWNDEIQNLLIFTSLFAATVTAFTIESYQWLEDDPQETSAKMLTQISLQLAHLSDPAQYRSVLLQSPLSFDPVPRPCYAVGVNILWFLSLAISLMVVLVGVICLQWIREYRKDSSSMSPRDAVALRQLRYEGLISWKVPRIISWLPTLLQISVSLFFLGLTYLLWELSPIVAGAIMPVLVVFALGLIGTAVASVVPLACAAMGLRYPKTQCPYKSPQAWTFYRFMCRLRRWVWGVRDRRRSRHDSLSDAKTWIELDQHWEERRKRTGLSNPDLSPDYVCRSVVWIMDNMTHQSDIWTQLHGLLPLLSLRDLVQIGGLPKDVLEIQSPSSGLRQCAELAILLAVPTVSWTSNPMAQNRMLERLENCIVSDWESLTSYISFERLIPLLDVFHRRYIVLRRGSLPPSQIATVLPNLLCACSRWVAQGVHRQELFVVYGDNNDTDGILPKQFLYSLVEGALVSIPIFTSANDAQTDGNWGPRVEAGATLNSGYLRLYEATLKLLLSIGDDYPMDRIVESFARQTSPFFLTALKYKYNACNSEVWTMLRDLTIAIEGTSRSLVYSSGNAFDPISFPPQWSLFYSIVTEDWSHLESVIPTSHQTQTHTQSPTSCVSKRIEHPQPSAIHFLHLVLKELSTGDFYRLLASHPTLTNLPCTQTPLTYEDLESHPMRVCMELSVLLKMESWPRLSDEWIAGVRVVAMDCLKTVWFSEPSLIFRLGIPINELSLLIKRAFGACLEDIITRDGGVIQRGFTKDMAREFFAKVGLRVGDRFLEEEAGVEGFSASVAHLPELGRGRIAFRILLGVLTHACDDDEGLPTKEDFMACIAGLDLVHRSGVPAWIDRAEVENVVRSSVRHTLEWYSKMREWKKERTSFGGLRERSRQLRLVDLLAKRARNVVATMGLTEAIEREYEEWNTIFKNITDVKIEYREFSHQ
ncbi:hypothetical protein AX16_009831 [Volvariella volvacea WC 439]|nr:hypothetical protein AX16_009831 [Volvariella volvacea WC 439]